MSSPPTRGRGNVTMKRPVRQKDRPDARTEGLGGRGSQEAARAPQNPRTGERTGAASPGAGAGAASRARLWGTRKGRRR